MELPDLDKVFGHHGDHDKHDPAQGWRPLPHRDEDDDMPPYRLVPDAREPITLDMVAATPREPRRYEQDPLAANMSAAQSAAQIILSDTRDTVRDDSERMQDLVSDMFHLCDLLGLDMDHLVNRAQRNYEAEIRGEL